MLGLSKYSCCERAGKEISISLTIREREKVGNVLWLPIPLEIRYHTAYLPIFKRWKEKYNLLRFAIFFSNKLICGKVGNISHEHDFGFWMGSQTSFQLRTEFEWVFNISWALLRFLHQILPTQEIWAIAYPAKHKTKRNITRGKKLLTESMNSCHRLGTLQKAALFPSYFISKVWIVVISCHRLPDQTQHIEEHKTRKTGPESLAQVT